MAEYIDREKAERELLNAMAMTGYQSRAINAVRYMPSEDVAPVKHGKWIEKDDGWGCTYYDCSACGESWVTIEGTPSENNMRYCPKCGAKMDLERFEK